MTDRFKIAIALVLGVLLYMTLPAPTRAESLDDARAKAAIDKALKAEGFRGPYDIQLSMRQGDGTGELNDLKLTDFSLDKPTGRFQAAFTGTDSDDVTREAMLFGRADRLASLPILKDRFEPDEIITREDIGWMTQPANRSSVGFITRADDLIGMTVRRTMRAGDPIRTTDIRKPYAVKKGERVTMMVRMGGLSISAIGMAMANGAIGETVRAQNIDSKQMIEGEVTAAGRIDVHTHSHIALAK